VQERIVAPATTAADWIGGGGRRKLRDAACRGLDSGSAEPMSDRAQRRPCEVLRLRNLAMIANIRGDAMPDPVRRPPGHPPQEPIIIKIPPRLPEAPEIDRSDDEEEEEAEIRRTPAIVPESPPPPRPEERAMRPAQPMRSTAISRWRAFDSPGPRS
jgi:hypothetical protein